MFVSLLTGVVGKRAAIALAAFLPYALGAVLLGFLWWYRYDLGYDDGVADTEAKIQKAVQTERLRQIEANSEALMKAQEKLEELRVLADERDQTIRELLDEADQDPDSARRAIGTDSVRRLNSIR